MADQLCERLLVHRLGIARCAAAAALSFAALLATIEPAKAGDRSAPIAVPSVQSMEFAEVSKNKILLVVSPDFFKLAIKLFQKENLPDSAVVIVGDMPKKQAAIFVNGRKFEFQDTTDNTSISDFEHQKLATAMVRLKAHLAERPKDR